MTFSLAARDPLSGEFGMVISSSSPAVAARCVHIAPGVGVVASQNVTNPLLGVRGLQLLRDGLSAKQVVADLTASEPFPAYRQLAVVDRAGQTAAFEGSATLGIHNVAHGYEAVAAGNLLANADVPAAMMEAFESSSQTGLEQRLLAAFKAAVAAGGEAGPIRSAGLSVVGPVEWPVTDLRVDDHDHPLDELARLLEVWLPQKDAYLTRALDPQSAPSYAVPGDE